MQATIDSALNEIIVKSKQLLLKLDGVSNDEEDITEALVSLQTERDLLLHNLFKEHSADELQEHIALVNHVVQLDAALIKKSLEFKHSFSKQLAKLKKGQKSTKTYLKY